MKMVLQKQCSKLSNERIKIMNKNLLSPLGEAIFPHLTIANVKFNPDGDYGVNLRLTEEKAKKMQAEIKEVLAT